MAADLNKVFADVRGAGFKVVMLTERGEGKDAHWLCTLARSPVSPMSTWKTGKGADIDAAVTKAMSLAKTKPKAEPPSGFEGIL